MYVVFIFLVVFLLSDDKTKPYFINLTFVVNNKFTTFEYMDIPNILELMVKLIFYLVQLNFL